MNCPVCMQVLDLNSAYVHLMTEHQVFMLTYMSMFNMFDDENDDYEYLSELCDRIGNHHVGLPEEKLDICAPVIIIDSEKDESCPICLDDISKKQYARRLVKCKHIYCGECIEEWLKKNHNCPVCKEDVNILDVNEVD